MISFFLSNDVFPFKAVYIAFKLSPCQSQLQCLPSLPCRSDYEADFEKGKVASERQRELVCSPSVSDIMSTPQSRATTGVCN